MKKIEIEIQYFPDCPNSKEFIERVKRALGRLDRGYEFRETVVDSSRMAKEIKFRGSPTLLINGADFEGADAPEEPGMNCRIYRAGLPDEEAILRKMEGAG